MSVVIDVAEAVKDEINDTTFSHPIEAARVRQMRRRKLEDLASSKEVVVCDVVHVRWDSELGDRGSALIEPVIDIFLRKSLLNEASQEQATGDIPTEELDLLEDLAEEVALHFQPEKPARSGRLATYEAAAWRETKVATSFDNGSRLWQARVQLTFGVYYE